MTQAMRRAAVWLVLCSGIGSTVHAADWPGWRGPFGDGSSEETGVVTTWAKTRAGKGTEARTENLKWAFPLKSPGHASPIVQGEHVFLVSVDVDTQKRELIAIDRASGKQRWRKTILTAPLETKHHLNSYASGTPATDGKLVFVSVLRVDGRTVPAPNVGKPRPVTPGEIVVVAYDFDGNEKWRRVVGSFVSAHGFSSSPVVFENLLLLNGDHDGPAYLTALNKQTGDIVWKTPRENETRSYCTPLVRQIDGRWQMLLSGSKCVASYDPHTGKRLWIHDGPTEQFVASLVMNAGLVFVTGGFPDKHILTIDPTGKGNITKSHVRWHHERNGVSYVPSPIAVGDRFLLVSDNGILTSFDAKSGEKQWQHRLGRRHSASPVTADGLVYFPDDDGITWVVKPGEEFELVAKNVVNEPVSASPAISNGDFFLRTDNNLYCFGMTTAE